MIITHKTVLELRDIFKPGDDARITWYYHDHGEDGTVTRFREEGSEYYIEYTLKDFFDMVNQFTAIHPCQIRNAKLYVAATYKNDASKIYIDYQNERRSLIKNIWWWFMYTLFSFDYKVEISVSKERAPVQRDVDENKNDDDSQELEFSEKYSVEDRMYYVGDITLGDEHVAGVLSHEDEIGWDTIVDEFSHSVNYHYD